MKKKLNHKIVNLAVFCLAATSCMTTTGRISRDNEAENSPKDTTEVKAPEPYNWDNAMAIDAFNAHEVKDLEEFVHRAPHVTDTIIITKDNYNKRLCAGAYIPKEDKVHLKFYIPDLTGCNPHQEQVILASVQRWNDENSKMADKAHEYHHRYIHKKGVFKLCNSAEDYARLCAHNEIAAYTCTFLYEREVVKKAIAQGLPPSVWRKIISSRFSEYWNAVEKGEVRLDNFFLNDEQKDNYLISSTVFNWWMKNEYDKNVHISSQRTESYLDRNKWAINYQRNLENYEKALDICYTFIKDGKIVNLNRYFKKNMEKVFPFGDLPCNTEYKDIDNQPEVKELIAQIRNVPGNMLYNPTPPTKVIIVKRKIQKQGR